jgi:phage major head subunit gpT-like protein
MGLPVFAPQQLRKDVMGTFIEAEMTEQVFLYERVSTIIPTTSDKENFAWLSQPASMEEFVDEAKFNPLADTGLTPQTGSTDPGYEVKVKTYQGGLLFKRDDLADEKTGGFSQRIQDQATVAQAFPDEALVTKLVAGTSDTCYIQVGATGEAFFSATHAARGKQTATWSNLLTGSGTGVANITTDIGNAIKALYTITNEANRPMNRHCKQLFILFPVGIEVNMRTAVLAAIVSSTSNVGFRPSIELIPEPLLDANSDDDYYIGTLDGGLRGLIWLEREGVVVEEVGPGSELWTNQRQIEYSVTRRGAPAYGFPQRLIKVNN